MNDLGWAQHELARIIWQLETAEDILFLYESFVNDIVPMRLDHLEVLEKVGMVIEK